MNNKLNAENNVTSFFYFRNAEVRKAHNRYNKTKNIYLHIKKNPKFAFKK